MDPQIRYLMLALLEDDIEFRDRLIDHLIAFSGMLNGIEARSIVSSSLYGKGVQNSMIKNIIRQEAIQTWLRSLRLSIRVGNVDV